MKVGLVIVKRFLSRVGSIVLNYIVNAVLLALLAQIFQLNFGSWIVVIIELGICNLYFLLGKDQGKYTKFER